MKFLVAQLGARMHYGVPRLLHAADRLKALHTDICGTSPLLRAIGGICPQRYQPNGFRRLLGRVPSAIPEEMIHTHSIFGLNYARRQWRAKSPAEITAVHLWAGSTFCNAILRRFPSFNADAVYTYNSAGLELLHAAKQQGLLAVMEQTIAPRTIEREILDSEYVRFHASDKAEPYDSWKKFADRERAEWDAADLIICGSEFVVEGIRHAGGPVEKTKVVPYGVDIDPSLATGKQRDNHNLLNVLFVGEVGIRKGAVYLIEAARQMRGSNIQVRFVGNVTLPQEILTNLPRNVKIVGPVPRSEIWREFHWADVFCLPSLCEGSATVVYEALAYGLPVVCTHNAGSVVRHGVEGYLVPIRNAHEIASCFELCASDENLLARLSKAARNRAAEYTLAKYRERLLAVLDRC